MKTLILASTIGIALMSGCAGINSNYEAFGVAKQPQHLSGSTLWLPRQ
ncbi:hypothetical protein [Helicobacter cappadocius]|uniref:Lipoprotein n=1 Tax=Helicobacter cappadocius TaxID=3063998 RepID=A0AA90PVX8_9HELI|nr:MULTISPECIES: hypothetical protein [unclassified Helicobacter]MDO7253325.1 hypothetical protein [Helicobacter sp. faydin-H75]MDP2539245.1 hypothetical protein [Helicobacter sp. faydin-H76]